MKEAKKAYHTVHWSISERPVGTYDGHHPQWLENSCTKILINKDLIKDEPGFFELGAEGGDVRLQRLCD